MTGFPWYDAGILFINYMGLSGFAGLLVLLGPMAHRRGGIPLLVLVGGMGMGMAWLAVLDTAGVIFGTGALPSQRLRAIVYRTIVAVTVWATLFIIRYYHHNTESEGLPP